MSATKDRDELELVKEALALARELQAEVQALRAGMDGADDGYHPMSEQDRLDLHEKLDEKADGELVWLLLTTQKFLETRSTGKLRNLAEHQTTIMAAVLERFAPGPLADGLAIYYEWQGDEDDEDDDDAG